MNLLRAFVCLLLFATTAKAESNAEALRQIGFLGTWSVDCAGRAIRLTVTPTTIQIKRYTTVADGLIDEYEIASATRVTEEKIQIIMTGTRRTSFDNEKTYPPTTMNLIKRLEIVMTKTGNKFQPFFWKGDAIEIENGYYPRQGPASSYEKCLN